MFPLTDNDPREIGGYRLLSCLGAGGMGRIYLAEEAEQGPITRSGSAASQLVVKVIRSEHTHDPTFRKRFDREIKLVQKVRGRYLAEVFEADTDSVPPWLAMEYIDGPSLGQRVAKHGPLSLEGVWKVAWGLANALHSVHEPGVVHRDLKPPNVMLAGDEPRLIDFGLAKVIQESTLTQITPVGAVAGTPSYMSPEQVLGREATPASDIFSLGGVLYFAATGRGPFGAADQATFYRIQHLEPDMDGVPKELHPLLLSCLAKDPENRPTPREIAQEVGWGAMEVENSALGMRERPLRLPLPNVVGHRRELGRLLQAQGNRASSKEIGMLADLLPMRSPAIGVVLAYLRIPGSPSVGEFLADLQSAADEWDVSTERLFEPGDFKRSVRDGEVWEFVLGRSLQLIGTGEPWREGMAMWAIHLLDPGGIRVDLLPLIQIILDGEDWRRRPLRPQRIWILRTVERIRDMRLLQEVRKNGKVAVRVPPYARRTLLTHWNPPHEWLGAWWDTSWDGSGVGRKLWTLRAMQPDLETVTEMKAAELMAAMHLIPPYEHPPPERSERGSQPR